jgi:hypothetical protein
MILDWILVWVRESSRLWEFVHPLDVYARPEEVDACKEQEQDVVGLNKLGMTFRAWKGKFPSFSISLVEYALSAKLWELDIFLNGIVSLQIYP